MPDEPPIPEWTEFEEHLNSRATPFEALGVHVSFPEGGVRLRLKPPDLISQGGCLLILVMVGCVALGWRALKGEITPGTSPYTDLLAGGGLLLMLLAALLFSYALASKRVLIDIRNNKLILTHKTLGWTRRSTWQASEIKSLGVHLSEGKDDPTRLEATLTNGDKEELLTDRDYLTLVITATFCRELLDIPKEVELVQPHQLRKSQPNVDTESEPPPIPAKDQVPAIRDGEVTRFHLKQPSFKVVAIGTLAWLGTVALSLVLGWWLNPYRTSDEEATLLMIIILGSALIVGMMSALASLIFPFVILNDLIADEWLEVDQTHLRFRRRRLPTRLKAWKLSDIEAIRLHREGSAISVRLTVLLEDGPTEILYASLKLNRARSVAHGITYATTYPIKVVEMDEEDSYDG